ncbi:unnamed protein product, partial [Ectocarpus sp. 12 AP-2014]
GLLDQPTGSGFGTPEQRECPASRDSSIRLLPFISPGRPDPGGEEQQIAPNLRCESSRRSARDRAWRGGGCIEESESVAESLEEEWRH